MFTVARTHSQMPRSSQGHTDRITMSTDPMFAHFYKRPTNDQTYPTIPVVNHRLIVQSLHAEIYQGCPQTICLSTSASHILYAWQNFLSWTLKIHSSEIIKSYAGQILPLYNVCYIIYYLIIWIYSISFFFFWISQTVFMYVKCFCFLSRTDLEALVSKAIQWFYLVSLPDRWCLKKS